VIGHRLVLTACLALLTACGPPPPPPGVGSLLPDIELATLEGESWSSDDLEGPAVITFWATWCQPCLKDIPVFNDLAEEGDLEIVAIALDESGPLAVEPFLADHAFRARILLGDEATFRRFGGSTVPHSLVVDSTHTVRGIFRGPVTRGEILASLATPTAGD